MRPHRQQPTRLPCPWDSPGKSTGVDCHFFLQCMKVKSESEVIQSCPTRSDAMDCSPPGSSIPGIFQARVLEWGDIAFFVECDYMQLKQGTGTFGKRVGLQAAGQESWVLPDCGSEPGFLLEKRTDSWGPGVPCTSGILQEVHILSPAHSGHTGLVIKLMRTGRGRKDL